MEGSGCTKATSGVRRSRQAEGVAGGVGAGASAAGAGWGGGRVPFFGDLPDRVGEGALPRRGRTRIRVRPVADTVAVREPTPGAGAAAWTDRRAGAAVGGAASSLWFERRRSGKSESVVARVSRMSAAIVVIIARADMTVRIPRRGIKGLDLLPTR